MAPPIVSRILDVVSMNCFNKRNQESDELRNIRIMRKDVKDVVNLPLDNDVQYHDKEGNSTNEHDPNRVF
jgi:hypothetical protein